MSLNIRQVKIYWKCSPLKDVQGSAQITIVSKDFVFGVIIERILYHDPMANYNFPKA